MFRLDMDRKYFGNLTPRERAIFEGAITMGALFHQFIGTPVSMKNVDGLEKTMEEAMELQPCIKKVEVKINRDIIQENENKFDYLSLTGEMLDVKVTSIYEDETVKVRLEYIKELSYPLMYVE